MSHANINHTYNGSSNSNVFQLPCQITTSNKFVTDQQSWHLITQPQWLWARSNIMLNHEWYIFTRKIKCDPNFRFTVVRFQRLSSSPICILRNRDGCDDRRWWLELIRIALILQAQYFLIFTFRKIYKSQPRKMKKQCCHAVIAPHHKMSPLQIMPNYVTPPRP